MKKNFLKLAFLCIILLIVVNTASAVSDADMQLLDQSSDDVSISAIDSTISSSSNNVSVNAIDLNISACSDDSSKDISVRDIDSNLGSGANVVSNDDSIISLGDPEKVTPTDTGAAIYFDNGYFGFCVDGGLVPANPTITFTVHNSSILYNNFNSAPIGDYLKILVYDYYHDYMKGDIESFWAYGSRGMVFFFSDLDFKDPAVIDEYSPDPIIIPDIIDKYDAGMRVPDHNAVKKINDTDYLIFDFIALIPDSGDVQTYFAFKVNSSHIDVNKTSNATGKIYKGDNLTYTIVVNNTNNFDMTCDVTDELPEGLEFVGASGDYDYNPSTRTIVWHIPNTAGETVNLEVYVTVTASNATIVESVVVSNKTYNITVGNNTTDYVESVVDLSVIKNVSVNKIKVGDKVVYIIVVLNNGPDVANNVIVKELLPSGVKFVSASVNKGIYNETTGVWTINTLNNGESATLKITVIATKAGIITNFVDVTCDEFDLDHSNNNDSVDIIVSTNNNTNSTNNTHDVINNHGIPMEHTGNPILVLLIMFVVFGTGLLRCEK